MSAKIQHLFTLPIKEGKKEVNSNSQAYEGCMEYIRNTVFNP